MGGTAGLRPAEAQVRQGRVVSRLPGDYRARVILTPLLLLAVGGIYWLDHTEALGQRRGAISALVLGLFALGGIREYIRMLGRGGFEVSRVLLPLMTLAICVSAFSWRWTSIDHEHSRIKSPGAAVPARPFPSRLIPSRIRNG